ncbi:hypothetical protein HKT18_09030 [Flavobacterium sp. IMCC34852]|uniref:Uncharacterized protein n=1 Tax=Flavobacterium rivulicola TaxID=2732161 RepID=A0A7Y3RA69_9FLAO|nr:hypothetical protein [Flavobacterium sp. IMCC34852]NNT72355.1 hypothetical protein [Flavobacterium sp. IMCC34852]
MEEKIYDWEDKRKNYLLVAIICSVIGLYFFLGVITGSYIFKNSELITIEELVISESPKFMETKGKNGRKWIEFKCLNTKANFKIENFDYKCVDDDEIIDNIKIADTVAITISKKKLSNIKEDSSCEIHGLVKKNKQYLNLECRNKADNNDGTMGFIMAFTLTIMTGLVASFSNKPKIFDKFDPEVLIWIVMIILFILLRLIL